MKSLPVTLLSIIALMLLTQVPLPDADVSTYFQPASPTMADVEIKRPEFHAVEILAKSAVVMSYPSGERIFEKNPDETLALASLAKLMTALVVKELIPDSAITFPVRILEEDILVEGDSGLFVGEEFLAEDLLNMMLVASSNDAAHALARSSVYYLSEEKESRFIDFMNKRARELGLASMFYLNEHGLDIFENRSSGFGSAADVAKLMSFILDEFSETLAATQQPEIYVVSASGRKITIKNSNILVSSMPGLIASKTGFTDIAGGNLAIAADVGFHNPVIIIVLGSTERGRFEDVLKLYDAAKAYYSSS